MTRKVSQAAQLPLFSEGAAAVSSSLPTPGELARQRRVQSEISPRCFRPSEHRWPAGPRPWVGEVVRVENFERAYPVSADAATIGDSVEVLAVRGSQRWVVLLDGRGQRRGAPVRLSRGVLLHAPVPHYACTLAARHAAEVAFETYTGRHDPHRDPIRRPMDWSYHAHRESERFEARREELERLATLGLVPVSALLTWEDPDKVFLFCSFRQVRP